MRQVLALHSIYYGQLIVFLFSPIFFFCLFCFLFFFAATQIENDYQYVWAVNALRELGKGAGAGAWLEGFSRGSYVCLE